MIVVSGGPIFSQRSQRHKTLGFLFGNSLGIVSLIASLQIDIFFYHELFIESLQKRV